MCIKVVRWFYCPVRKDGCPKGKDWFTEMLNHSNPTDDIARWKEGEYVSFNELEDLQTWMGFFYVRHSIVSWIRCAPWTNEACTDDGAPLQVRYLAFKHPCPGCNGVDKCMSRYENAWKFKEQAECTTPEHPLTEDQKQLGLRRIASNAFDFVLRTEAARYVAQGLPFDVAGDFPPLWNREADREWRLILPMILPDICREDTSDINFYELYDAASDTRTPQIRNCQCANSQFHECHNNLLSLYKHSGAIFRSNEGDDAMRIYLTEMANSTTVMQDYAKALSTGSALRRGQHVLQHQEWWAASTEPPNVVKERLARVRGAVDSCLAQLEPQLEEALGVEQLIEQRHALQKDMKDTLDFRYKFATSIGDTLALDAGFPQDALHHWCYLACAMMLPWGIEHLRSVPELEDLRIYGEDLTVMKAFVAGIDRIVDRETLAQFQEGWRRDHEELDPEIHAIQMEVVSNWKHVYDSVEADIENLVIFGEEAHEILTDKGDCCVLCTEPWVVQKNVPDHWRIIQLPCCKQVCHEKDVRAACYDQPERYKKVLCPLCHTDMRENYGWYRGKALRKKIKRSTDKDTYQCPEGFIEIQGVFALKPDYGDDEEDDEDDDGEEDGEGMEVDEPDDNEDDLCFWE